MLDRECHKLKNGFLAISISMILLSYKCPVEDGCCQSLLGKVT